MLSAKQAITIAVTTMTIIFGLALLTYNTASADSMDCFNLEISQAQLQTARANHDKPAIRKARKLVKQWSLFCKQVQ